MTRKSEAPRPPSIFPSPAQDRPHSAVWRISPNDAPPETLHARLRAGEVRIGPDARRIQFVGATQNGLSWETDSDIATGPAPVTIGGVVTLHRADVIVLAAEGHRVETTRLENLAFVRARKLKRIAAPQGLRIACLGEEHPVCDLSDEGASFSPTAADGFEVGAILPVAFNWHDRLRVLARLTIAHVTKVPHAGIVVGGKLSFDDEDDLDRHHEEVDALSYPFTKSGYTCSRDLWELFVDSGYFSLSSKTPADFAVYEPAFRKMSKALARSRRVGVQIVYPTSRGVDCSYGVIAEYPKTCMSIHTGRRSKGRDPRGIAGREVLRDAYIRVIDWIRRIEADWMSVWVQDAAPPFIKGMLLNFVESRVDGKLADIHKFYALEMQTAPTGHRTSLDVRPMIHGEEKEVFAGFRARYPALLGEARRWHPNADISSNWAEAGLTRERAVIVARRDGELRGAAICESVPEGIHVYGLFDVVHMIFDDGDRETEAALLERIRAFYAGLEKRRFIYAARTNAVEGSTDLGLTHGTLLSTKLFPELYEHIWDFMSPKS